MKQFISTILLLTPCCLLFAQREKADIRKGNQLYQEQKYKEAEDSYRKSVGKKAETLEGNFNLGDALYKQKQYDKAQEQFNKIAGTNAANKMVASKAYHNLGNSLLESKKLEESIDAYKKALINDPKDDQTRYNLAYAQEMLKKQQQQKKNQDKNNKDQNKNDQKKDQNKQDQNKQDQDKDKKDQNKDQNKQDQDKKDQQNGQQPNKISKEDAERMLDALNNQEKETQDKLKNKKLKGAKVKITKDW